MSVQNVWIANGIAMMNMKTSVRLNFMDIYSKLKINEIENIRNKQRADGKVLGTS